MEMCTKMWPETPHCDGARIELDLPTGGEIGDYTLILNDTHSEGVCVVVGMNKREAALITEAMDSYHKRLRLYTDPTEEENDVN